MAKGMHMVIGLSSLNTRKRKLKITKQRMLELVEEHRLYNKKMKQSNNSDMMMSFVVIVMMTINGTGCS